MSKSVFDVNVYLCLGFLFHSLLVQLMRHSTLHLEESAKHSRHVVVEIWNLWCQQYLSLRMHHHTVVVRVHSVEQSMTAVLEVDFVYYLSHS